MKNERHYGWGNEYYDCHNRFTNLANNVYRFDAPLFHLCHPRKENSSFRPKTFHHISSNELKSSRLFPLFYLFQKNQYKCDIVPSLPTGLCGVEPVEYAPI